MKKDLNKLSFQELEKEIEKLKQAKEEVTTKKVGIYQIGKPYLIRTVTMIYTGKLVNVTEKELVITNACWIPETERWADTCEKGTFKEIEPYPKEAEVIINKEALLDMFQVDWELPNKQK